MDEPETLAPPVTTTNGVNASHERGKRPQPQDLSQVLQALEAIYDPRSSNEIRKQASHFLDEAKQLPEAPQTGFTLASDKSQPSPLRHYGLSMLEHSIKYGYDSYSTEQALALRQYILQLAQSVDQQDPPYLRNKVAQLWTEVAKRSWALDWMDMDEQLVNLWGKTLEHTGIVLSVLETLSEEVFNREDPVAALRGHELGRAVVEIFSPNVILVEQLPGRDSSLNVRYGDEGWIARLCQLVDWCITEGVENNERNRSTAIRALQTLRAAMPWIMAKVIVATNAVEHICKGLSVAVPHVQTASVEALYAIYYRPLSHEDDFIQIVCPMFTSRSVTLLRQIYDWTIQDMDVNNLNEEKYTLCKKLSELLSNIGAFLEQRPSLVPEGSDLEGIFSLLYDVLRNPSLVVSIPVLHTWTKLLRSNMIRDSAPVSQMIPHLLETCSQRLVQYEALPEDSTDVTFLFLNEDIDTIPERHAFLGNYRRYCIDVVEIIVRKMPTDAMHHILTQADQLFKQIHSELPSFQAQTFSKHSIPVLKVDSQIRVVDAALKGYLKWIASQEDSSPQRNEQDRKVMQDTIQQWCEGVLALSFEDPEIKKKLLQLIVSFATKVLNTRAAFSSNLLQYIINVSPVDDPGFPQYAESVKELERACSIEIQRLAMAFPDHFMGIYDELVQQIESSPGTHSGRDRQKLGYRAFLFIVVHRSTSLNKDVQTERLKEMMQPVRDAWQDPAFSNAVASFPAFCQMLGLGRLPEFFTSRQFSRVSDWSAQQLDADGQAMQAAILEHFQQLPLRLTKTMLAASTEKLREGSPIFTSARNLWADAMPSVLPNLLQLVSHAQAFNNLDNWSHLPEELRTVVKRVLTDRFWQAGISTESRDDFFARVSGSKSTFEGFASTVRGTVRQIRETSYFILYALSRFADVFYSIDDLPGPLSEALYENAISLSAHHLSVLLSMSTQLIDGCPPTLRQSFLPPILSCLFKVLDGKITSEWEAINRQISEKGENDNLGDEMKTESILRQLTYSAVSLVSNLLDFQRIDTRTNADSQQYLQQHGAASNSQRELAMWNFILNTPDVLEPILMFCKNMIRVRDTRCCALALRVLRATVPYFREDTPVRKYICSEMLQAAIMSLNEHYFVDVQKDLASLIAQITQLDQHMARELLLQLSGLRDRADKVDRALERIKLTSSERQQRAFVLELLSSIRGVSIHEQGKLNRPEPKKRSVVQEQYMTVDENPTVVRGGSPHLAGMADMFG